MTNGVQGGNEFTIDGSPNMSNARGVGFSPPSDAIEQFKVQTNAFDAQSGHTAGAVVNLAREERDQLAAPGDQLLQPQRQPRGDAAADDPQRRHEADARVQPLHRHAERTGGAEPTFFMGSFEHLRDVQPEPATYTVPTESDAPRRLQRVHARRSSIRPR